MKTNQDVIEAAFRRLGIKAEGEGLSADQNAYAEQVLESLHHELSIEAPQTWFPERIEDAAFVPLSNLLAAEIGPAYGVPVEPRSRPFARLMAVVRPDNRLAADKPTGQAAYF